jgi:hypothetical protein
MLTREVDNAPVQGKSVLVVGHVSKIHYTWPQGDIVMRCGVEERT